MKKRLLTLLFFLYLFPISAQLDTKHWFAPMVDAVGNYRNVQQIYLSTNQTTAFEVTVYNNNNVIGKVKISKGNPSVFDIPREFIITTNSKKNISDKLFKPTKLGLYVEGKYAFFANLRFSTYNHAEFITSKGKAGIGNTFYTVMAPISTINTLLNFTTSILATEDNTTVNITNFNPELDFSDGISRKEFQFKLNKGESYIIEGKGNPKNKNGHFIGAKITSNHPISVTNGNFNGQYAGDYRTTSDILMDQNVPIEHLGKEFILVKGNGDIGKKVEGAIIVATKNNTSIFLNHRSNSIINLNEGEYYIVPDNNYINQGNEHYNMYIETNENVYVYQLLAGSSTSPIASVGMNFVPPISCFLPKSIDEIGLINQNKIYHQNSPLGTDDIPTKLNIITEKNANLTVNSQLPNHIDGPYPVTGNENWVTYGIPNQRGNVTILSDKSVMAGITAGIDAAGYGGFFAGLPTKPTIVKEGCYPNTTLIVTPTIFESYQWFLNGFPINGAIQNTYVPKEEGDYSVEVKISTCNSISSEIIHIEECLTKTELEIKECSNNEIIIAPAFSKKEFKVDISSIKIITEPKYGTIKIDTKTGKIMYSRISDSKDKDQFQYLFCDENQSTCELVTATINIEDIKAENTTIYSCNDNNIGIFDLTKARVTEEEYNSKQYYETKEDAERGINEIKNSSKYESKKDKIIYVLIKNERNCKQIAEIKLDFYPEPQLDLSQLTTNFCGTETTVNLDDITKQILLNNELFIVKYYNNKQDAKLGNENTLPHHYTVIKNKSIYIRIENLNLDCNPLIEELNFKFNKELHLFIDEYSTNFCNNNFENFQIINLNDYLSNYTDDSSLEVSYFLNKEDALNNKNEISNQQEIHDSQSFYIRFYHSKHCPSIAKLTLNKTNPEKSELLKDIQICPLSKVKLDAGNHYRNYLWNTNETTSSIEVGAGDYWVELTSENSCFYKHSIHVSEFEIPVIKSIIQQDDKIIIKVTGGTPPYSFSLDKINWQTSNIFHHLKMGEYTIYVKSSDNCKPIEKRILVYKIPNFISPNGDGINDTWKVKLPGLKNNRIQIFDRFGKIIIDKKFDNEFIWNGKLNGFTLPSDSYWYLIKLNEKETISSFILLKNKKE
ncbi:T9SS type B sorting domain-containing protein [Chishuiella sp.]|uniref:T9SS type B sorting domain-containing protein n=1 Tax=Chishuiella sp. TaxID=1969467 RepID=UPI0028AE9EFF|nr:T9SS type B sorting domain-containing protein [Chishuiella sp.]